MLRRRRQRTVKPLRGLMVHHGSITQGALRDPGLWSRTPSALNRRLGLVSTYRHALSLVEVVASTMIVGLMAVAALNSLGAATRSSTSIGNRAVALGLAEELMAEILQQAYREPSGAVGLGRDSGELLGPRSVFDDVDDYSGWNQSPPQYRDGSVMAERANWRHRVYVTYVVPSNPTQTSATDQGALQVRVTVEYRDQLLAELIAVRTDTDPE